MQLTMFLFIFLNGLQQTALRCLTLVMRSMKTYGSYATQTDRNVPNETPQCFCMQFPCAWNQTLPFKRSRSDQTHIPHSSNHHKKQYTCAQSNKNRFRCIELHPVENLNTRGPPPTLPLGTKNECQLTVPRFITRTSPKVILSATAKRTGIICSLGIFQYHKPSGKSASRIFRRLRRLQLHNTCSLRKKVVRQVVPHETFPRWWKLTTGSCSN